MAISFDSGIDSDPVLGGASGPILPEDLPANIDASKIGAGGVGNTEFGFLDGVTSAIQTQLNAKIDGPLSAADISGAIWLGDAGGTNAAVTADHPTNPITAAIGGMIVGLRLVNGFTGGTGTLAIGSIGGTFIYSPHSGLNIPALSSSTIIWVAWDDSFEAWRLISRGPVAAADITTGTLADARIPNLAADKIISGVFSPARIMSPVPSSASASGTAGQTAYASGFFYVCVATNTWQRVAIATW